MKQSDQKPKIDSGHETHFTSALAVAAPVSGDMLVKRAKHLPMRGTEAILNPPAPLVVEHAGLRLHSAFQPIISVVHSKIVGYEALIRGHNELNLPLSPAELFPQLVATMSASEVNEVCARLHLASFAQQNQAAWLFINVSPDAMPDRDGVVSQFGRWLESSDILASQVVVEIIETRAFDEKLLADAVAGFRDLGCLVAIDDFGAGESNFERVWRLRPDIVKLDRAMITQAADNPLVQRILPGLVSLVHEAGCLVVMEGIETERQALIAVESDVDFVQGYYFRQPGLNCHDSSEVARLFDGLTRSIKTNEEQRFLHDRGYFASFAAGLEACASALEEGLEFHDACQTFLAVAGVQRLYELDAQGYQIGDNLESPGQLAFDRRFSPCSDAKGANWFRRPYFQRAIAAPGAVQVSRPYLSIRDARNCVTMSLAFETEVGLRILCADLDVQQADPTSRVSLRDSSTFSR